MESFYFYDLETSGRDPRWHRIVQFAGLRTDRDLRPLEEPVSWLVALDDDVVPEPEAALVTGLVPADCADGIDEGELFRRIAAEFGRPGTCVVGYNNLRFDDEFVRYGLWRDLRDPYAREWQGGNSRWDLVDLVRMAAALRPEGIVWPEEDGRKVFRLEALAAANGIDQARAHDAASDVHATLGLARRLREAQPRLFDFYLGLRDKRTVADLLLPPLSRALVHVSGRYPAEAGRMAVVAAVATHPVNRNAVIVADLSAAPDPLETLDGPALAERLFTPADDLGDRARPPLKEVHLNRVPALAPLGVLREEDRARLGVDLERCAAHLERLRALPDLAERVRAAYAPRPRQAGDDVDGELYGGFLPDADRRLFVELREADEATLAHPPALEDPRSRELFFRWRARRHPATLGPEERERWHALVADRLARGRPGMPSLAEARARIAALGAEGGDARVLEGLGRHLDALEARWPVPGTADA
jgi:exodeoxyribonuclease-1